MVRKIGPMPEVRNSDTASARGRRKGLMAAAIAGSVGGVAMAFRRDDPTQAEIGIRSAPALNISMEWRRKLAVRAHPRPSASEWRNNRSTKASTSLSAVIFPRSDAP